MTSFCACLWMALTLVDMACAAGDSDKDAKLKTILGVTWSELKACHVDSDCVATFSFDNICCAREFINRTYLDAVQAHGKALVDAFMTPSQKREATL